MNIKASRNNPSDGRVLQMQTELNAIGRSRGLHWNNLGVDGIYGPLTAKVVKQFAIWDRQLSLATDSEGLPLCTDTVLRAVNVAYDRLPKISAAPGPILTSATRPCMLVAVDGAASRRMLDAEPLPNSRTTLLPDWVTQLVDNTVSIIQGIISEVKLLRDLRTKNPYAVLDHICKSSNPKIEAIRRSYTNWQIMESRDTTNIKWHTNPKLQTKVNYRKTVNEALPIGKRFDDWLKKYKVDQKIKRFMDSKFMQGRGGTVVKAAAKPVAYIWLFKDVIKDLCILAFRLVTGKSIDQAWWDNFENNLTSLADGLIAGLIAELVIAGLVAVGALAGPATLVAALIGLVVAIVFGVICDKAEFSPSKFFADIIAKSIARAISGIESTITRGSELYATAIQGNRAVK